MSASVPAVGALEAAVVNPTLSGRRQRTHRKRSGRQSDPRYQLPDDAISAARTLGAPADQIQKAEAMQRCNLTAKGKRQALCCVLGAEYDCSDTGCKRRYYRRFGCKCRYCPHCGPRLYSALFSKYAALHTVAHQLSLPGSVIAKLDFTTKNLKRMPTAEEVRVFNLCIKRFLRRLERELHLNRKHYGIVYCNEFGGASNTNLHAHALYVGPRLPRPKTRNGKRLGLLAQWWHDACKGTVFAGSFIISVKRAGSFLAGLAHALKYAGKFLSRDPNRLADLELAFHGVRRVHTLAAFYRAVKPAVSESNTLNCPDCGAALVRIGPWQPIERLERIGCQDLDQRRRAVGREQVLRGPPAE
jgi:hypothetical protein